MSVDATPTVGYLVAMSVKRSALTTAKHHICTTLQSDRANSREGGDSDYSDDKKIQVKIFVKCPPALLEQRLKIIVNNLSINCPILVALFVGKVLTLYR